MTTPEFFSRFPSARRLMRDNETVFCCRYDWFQTDSLVTVAIYTRCEYVCRDSVIVELKNQQFLSVAVIVNDDVFHVSQELEGEVSSDYKGKNCE